VASAAPNREQLTALAGKDFDLLKKLEDLFETVLSTPVQPITANIDTDTTFTLENESGNKTILIPEEMLVASIGGPFTLTLTTGSGAVVLVPIAAFGDTILSGALKFSIEIDASGNVTSDSWFIDGSNARGTYREFSSGGMTSEVLSALGTAAQPWIFPVPFVANPLTWPVMATTAPFFATTANTTQTSVISYGWDTSGAGVTNSRRVQAIGRWRT